MSTREYRNGCWTFESDDVFVAMEDATYQQHLNTYLESQGLSTLTCLEWQEEMKKALDERVKAGKVLENPDYWRESDDPRIHLLHKRPMPQRS